MLAMRRQRLNLVSLISFCAFTLLGCSQNLNSITEQNPKKVECVDSRGRLIFSSTVVSAAEMATRKGFQFTDMNGVKMEVVGHCKVVD